MRLDSGGLSRVILMPLFDPRNVLHTFCMKCTTFFLNSFSNEPVRGSIQIWKSSRHNIGGMLNFIGNWTNATCTSKVLNLLKQCTFAYM